jgi:hypothetical protein
VRPINFNTAENIIQFKVKYSVDFNTVEYATPLYPQKLALTSPIGVGRSVGTVRSRTKAT